MKCNLVVQAALAVAMLGLAGCGSELVDVSGTVTLDGTPLASGRVVFQAPGKPMAVGELGPGGQYTVKTGTRQGIPPGDYTVTVSSYEVGQSTGRGNPPPARLVTPRRYNNVKTSDLEAAVRPANKTFNFSLTGE
jgi:hypothetical protein